MVRRGLRLRRPPPQPDLHGSLSYVTGSHSFKVGFDMQRGHFWRGDNNDSTGGIWYRTTERVPLRDDSGAHAGWQDNLNYNLGIYAQDRWTTNRLTLSGGVRLDLQNESTSASPSGRIVAAEPQRQLPGGQERAELEGRQPAVSVAYDLFGNGKTALKASVSRGVEQDSIRYAANNPAPTRWSRRSAVVRQRGPTRTHDFMPDCDLNWPQPNGECWCRGTVPDFGSPGSHDSTIRAIMEGWGVRPYNWEFSAASSRK